jgi:hypothetical protein
MHDLNFGTSSAIYEGMMKVEDIEKAVTQLDPAELDKFRAWYEAFDAQREDRTRCEGGQVG